MEKEVALTSPAAHERPYAIHLGVADTPPIVRWSGAADVFGTAIYTCLPHTGSSPWISHCNA
jgi:hypothetical protein